MPPKRSDCDVELAVNAIEPARISTRWCCIWGTATSVRSSTHGAGVSGEAGRADPSGSVGLARMTIPLCRHRRSWRNEMRVAVIAANWRLGRHKRPPCAAAACFLASACSRRKIRPCRSGSGSGPKPSLWRRCHRGSEKRCGPKPELRPAFYCLANMALPSNGGMPWPPTTMRCPLVISLGETAQLLKSPTATVIELSHRVALARIAG
jgi:hypothetical protein